MCITAKCDFLNKSLSIHYTDNGIQRHPLSLLEVMGQYVDKECTLERTVFHDSTKHRCNHHDAVKMIYICLKP